MEATSASEGKDPSAFLGEITGAPVTVKLNSGVVYKGAFSLSLAIDRTLWRWLSGKYSLILRYRRATVR